MILLGLLVSGAIAAATPTDDLLTGLYVSKDGKYSALLQREELSAGDLFTPAEYGYKAQITSTDKASLEFEQDVTLEMNDGKYSFSSEIECDDPGCDYYQDFEVELKEDDTPSIQLSYSGFTYEDGDTEERPWVGNSTLIRAYLGSVTALAKEEALQSKSVQKLVLARMKKDLRDHNLIQEDSTILSTVYKKVLSGSRVGAIYVTTKALTLPVAMLPTSSPRKAQCDMIVVKNESKWNIKYSDCYIGEKSVEYRP